MKNLKKAIAAILLGAVVLMFASCGSLVPSVVITVDPETGSGTASFTVNVPKNAVEGVGNNFAVFDEENNNTNQGYITSAEKVLELAKASVPEGFDVTMTEDVKMVVGEDEEEYDVGSFDYTVSFSFTSIEDYNAKINNWLAAEHWEAAKAYASAESIDGLTLVTENGETTLTADMRILEVVCQWVFTLFSTDTTGAVIDGGNGFTYEYCYNMDKGSVQLNLGTKDVNKQYSSTKPSVSVKVASAPATAEPTAEPGEIVSPQTGELSYIPAVIICAVAAIGMVVVTKKKHN